jgi:predicted transposase/invertase (TIGR01784 family)
MGYNNVMDDMITLPEILPAYDDGIFKAIFTRHESEPALIDIIETFTGLSVKEITVKNSERTIQNADDKRIRFDINCITKDGKMIDIEMQASAMEGDNIDNAHAGIRERSLYYEAMLHSSQPRPKDYSAQLMSIQLTICNYNVFPDDKLIRHFVFTDEYGNELSKSMSIIFVELPKLDVNKPIENMTDLEEWALYLRYSNNVKYQNYIETLKERKEVFRMAYETQVTVSQDDIAKAWYMSRLKYELDESHNQSMIRKGAIKQVARNLIKLHTPIQTISQATGLSESELRAIQEQL